MNYSLTFLLLFLTTVTFGQQFILEHENAGLGSTAGETPSERIVVTDSVLVLTYPIRSEHPETDPETGESFYPDRDTVFRVSFRQSSIDSIRTLLTGLENREVSASNVCIKSGSVVIMDILTPAGRTHFFLANSHDSVACKIVLILNDYLPENQQIYIPYDRWKIADNCRYQKPGSIIRPLNARKEE